MKAVSPLPVTLTPPAAPPGSAATGCGPDARTPGAGFADLVAALLATPGTTAPAVGRPGRDPQVPTEEPAAESAEAPTGIPEAGSVPVQAVGVVPAALVAPVPAPDGPAAATTSVEAPAPSTSAVTPDASAALLENGSDTGAAPGVDATGGQSGGQAGGRAGGQAGDSRQGTGQETAQASASTPAPSTPAPTTTATAAPSGVPVPGTGPVAPTAPTAAAVPTVATETAAPRTPVIDQLLPAVSRLASGGDGVHRITMKLQPEALGEVRVTLTVRHGEVQVRLAAGDEAQRSLIEAAPELRRVLEASGAAEARVVVRDLLPGSTLTPTSTGLLGHDAATGGDPQRFGDTAASHQGRDGTPDQHARTRGGHDARDGLTDGAPLRPEPARRDPHRGLDLTM